MAFEAIKKRYKGWWNKSKSNPLDAWTNALSDEHGLQPEDLSVISDVPSKENPKDLLPNIKLKDLKFLQKIFGKDNLDTLGDVTLNEALNQALHSLDLRQNSLLTENDDFLRNFHHFLTLDHFYNIQHFFINKESKTNFCFYLSALANYLIKQNISPEISAEEFEEFEELQNKIASSLLVPTLALINRDLHLNPNKKFILEALGKLIDSIDLQNDASYSSKQIYQNLNKEQKEMLAVYLRINLFFYPLVLKEEELASQVVNAKNLDDLIELNRNINLVQKYKNELSSFVIEPTKSNNIKELNQGIINHMFLQVRLQDLKFLQKTFGDDLSPLGDATLKSALGNLATESMEFVANFHKFLTASKSPNINEIFKDKQQREKFCDYIGKLSDFCYQHIPRQEVKPEHLSFSAAPSISELSNININHFNIFTQLENNVLFNSVLSLIKQDLEKSIELTNVLKALSEIIYSSNEHYKRTSPQEIYKDLTKSQKGILLEYLRWSLLFSPFINRSTNLFNRVKKEKDIDKLIALSRYLIYDGHNNDAFKRTETCLHGLKDNVISNKRSDFINTYLAQLLLTIQQPSTAELKTAFQEEVQPNRVKLIDQEVNHQNALKQKAEEKAATLERKKAEQKQIEEEKKLKEAEAQRKKEEKQKREEEEKKRKKAEEEQKRKAEEEKRQKAEEEKKRKAEEEKRKKAEEETKRKAEEDKRKKAEEEKKRKAEEEKRKKAEEEKKRKAEEEKRKKAEEEAKRKAEEDKRNKAEEQKRKEQEDKRKEAELKTKTLEEEKTFKDSCAKLKTKRSGQHDFVEHSKIAESYWFNTDSDPCLHLNKIKYTYDLNSLGSDEKQLFLRFAKKSFGEDACEENVAKGKLTIAIPLNRTDIPDGFESRVYLFELKGEDETGNVIHYGHASLSEVDKKESFTLDMAIKKEFCGQGIGTRAVRAIALICDDDRIKCDKVALAVGNDNPKAALVYARAGFQPTPESLEAVSNKYHCTTEQAHEKILQDSRADALDGIQVKMERDQHSPFFEYPSNSKLTDTDKKELPKDHKKKETSKEESNPKKEENRKRLEELRHRKTEELIKSKTSAAPPELAEPTAKTPTADDDLTDEISLKLLKMGGNKFVTYSDQTMLAEELKEEHLKYGKKPKYKLEKSKDVIHVRREVADGNPNSDVEFDLRANSITTTVSKNLRPEEVEQLKIKLDKMAKHLRQYWEAHHPEQPYAVIDSYEIENYDYLCKTVGKEFLKQTCEKYGINPSNANDIDLKFNLDKPSKTAYSLFSRHADKIPESVLNPTSIPVPPLKTTP